MREGRGGWLQGEQQEAKVHSYMPNLLYVT